MMIRAALLNARQTGLDKQQGVRDKLVKLATWREGIRDMAVMRGLLANGFGYSIVNMRPLNDLAPDGKPLRFVPLTGSKRPMKLGVLMGAGAERTQLHKAFVDHAQSWIESQTGKLLGVRSPLG